MIDRAAALWLAGMPASFLLHWRDIKRRWRRRGDAEEDVAREEMSRAIGLFGVMPPSQQTLVLFVGSAVTLFLVSAWPLELALWAALRLHVHTMRLRSRWSRWKTRRLALEVVRTNRRECRRFQQDGECAGGNAFAASIDRVLADELLPEELGVERCP